jgi:hypothetical protein
MAESDDLVVPSHGEAEHELISTSVDIEEIDTGLYRSKTLWLPSGARGVFGGQVSPIISIFVQSPPTAA